MSKVVYLVGHGRVANTKVVEVPDRMTMHWLGHLGDVSNGISYAFLAGELTAEINSSGPKDQIPEHYLCGERADIDPVVDTKIKSFFDRQTAHPLGCPNPYVLYTRGRTNVSLTTIFKFLDMLSPSADWHLYWTCCRGYIGKNNPLTSTYVKESGTVERLPRVDPEATPELASGGHKTFATATFENIRLIAHSDRNVVSDTAGIEQTLGQSPLAHQLIDPRFMGRKPTAKEWDGDSSKKTNLEKAFAKDF